jgi:hypothetical protein
MFLFLTVKNIITTVTFDLCRVGLAHPNTWKLQGALRFIFKIRVQPVADPKFENCRSGYFKRPLIRTESGL